MKIKAKKIMVPVLVIVLLLGGYKGISLFRHYNNYELTDDAQIDGNIVPVVARVGGYIHKLRVTENQMVKAGDLLIDIDSVELYANYKQALAALESAKANLAVAQANATSALQAKKVAEASLSIPKTNLWKAKSDYDRYNELYEQKLATPQQIDNFKAAYETAQSQYNVARQKTESVKLQYQTALSQVKVAESNVFQGQTNLEHAELELSYAKVTAPVTGTVSKNTLQPGQLIQPGQPLMSVVQDQNVWVTANFKETQMIGIKEGNEVIIQVDAYPDLKVTGTVQSTSGATGAKFSLIPPDNASGNYVKVVQRIPVRIKINQTDETRKLLKPGMSVYVEVKK
ncbi:MAG: HlyD family secretion protein [Cyclobacteriaceae bacterium]|nr:HlyD family secretion protein [Cyclobacteriaceae bacterium]